MKELVRKLGIALLAACAGAIGNAVGQVACDTIKETFDPEAKKRRLRKSRRTKR